MLYEARKASGPVTLCSRMLPHMPPLLGDTPQLDLPPLQSSCPLRDRDYGSAEHRTESGAEKLSELEDDHCEWRMACASTSYFLASLLHAAGCLCLLRAMRSSAIKAVCQQAPKELVCNGRMRAEWTVHINPHCGLMPPTPPTNPVHNGDRGRALRLPQT